MGSLRYVQEIANYLNESNKELVETWACAYDLLGKNIIDEQMAVSLALGELSFCKFFANELLGLYNYILFCFAGCVQNRVGRLHTQGGLFTRCLKSSTQEPMYTEIFLRNVWTADDDQVISLDEIDQITIGKKFRNGKYPKRVVKKVAKLWVTELSGSNEWNRARDFVFLQRCINVIGLPKTKRLINVVKDIYGKNCCF